MVRAKWSIVLLFLFAFASLAGCGRQSELSENQSAQLQSALVDSLGSEDPVSNPLFQNEVQMVMSEVNSAIAQALLPGFSTSAFSSKAAVSLGCSPDIDFVLIGVNITFTSSSSCSLNGTVTVKLFPTTVTVDITAAGLSFIDKIELDGTYSLNGTASFSLTFLNGRISLKEIAGFSLGSIIVNGSAAVSTSPAFTFTSRVNAFASTGNLGVALMSTLKPSAGVRTIQGCLLSGADPMNPNAGKAQPCFGI